LQIAPTLGSVPIMLTCRRRLTTVAEVTYCKSISVAEHTVMSILGLVRNYIPSYEWVMKGGGTAPAAFRAPRTTTTPGKADTRNDASARVAFRVVERAGTQGIPNFISRLDGWPVRTHADASPVPSRMLTHGSGRCGSLPFIVADFHRLLLASLLAHRQPGSKA
jgi:lactate dehydrogenase-like 2-hydroxyacid dehydrogenase